MKRNDRRDRNNRDRRDRGRISESGISKTRKPKSNLVFCIDCNRRKQLYDTEAEANRYIEYNKDEIEAKNGYAPCRAYYCSCCGGWHVTSRESFVEAEKSPSDILIEKYHEDRDNFSLWKKSHRMDTKMNLRWDESSFLYVCLKLTESARTRLRDNIPEEYRGLYENEILHHVTLLHRSNYDPEVERSEKVVRFVKRIIADCNQSARMHFVVDGIGCSDKALAYRVKLSTPCYNKNPHITIGVFNGGRPVDSNDITEWVDIPKMNVDAILEVVYPDNKNDKMNAR